VTLINNNGVVKRPESPAVVNPAAFVVADVMLLPGRKKRKTKLKRANAHTHLPDTHSLTHSRPNGRSFFVYGNKDQGVVCAARLARQGGKDILRVDPDGSRHAVVNVSAGDVQMLALELCGANIS
jgi:hypothetical protein